MRLQLSSECKSNAISEAKEVVGNEKRRSEQSRVGEITKWMWEPDRSQESKRIKGGGRRAVEHEEDGALKRVRSGFVRSMGKLFSNVQGR